MYILCVLDRNGAMRFGDLRRNVEGVSPKVLTEKLRMLEALGIIHRHYNPTVPPQVTYALTARGKELSLPLYQLCDLVFRWYGDDA
jgi:DNA-binding HxlR family transcriptional regulator